MLQFTPNKGKGVDLFGKKKLPVSPETSLPEVPGIVPPNQSKAPPTGVPSEVPPQAFQGIDSEITGEQAIEQGKQAYLNNRQEIPQVTQQDALGSAVTGEAEEQNLEQVSGSEFGGRQGYHSVYNPETGQYEERPMTKEDYQTQLDFEQQQNPSFAPSSLDFSTGSRGDVQEKLQAINEARMKATNLRKMEGDRSKYAAIPEDAQTETEKEYSSLESVAGRFSDAMDNDTFSPVFNDIFGSKDEEGQPLIDPAYRGTVVSLMALSELDSSSRDAGKYDFEATNSVDSKDRPSIVDSSGQVLPDHAEYVKDKISSIDSSLAIGLERAGIKIPSAQRRQLAALSLAQAMKTGKDYKMVKGFDGSDIIIPTKEKMDQRNNLKSAIEGTVKATGRLAPSRVRQIGGADLIAGGPKVVSASRSSFSILSKEAKAKAKETGDSKYLIVSDAAHMTQDMFGAIDERVPLVSAQVYTKIYGEVMAPEQIEEGMGYSKHDLADKLNVGKKAFNKLRGKYKPSAAKGEVGNSPEAKQRREAAKTQHAIARMKERMAERKQAFDDMGKLIAAPNQPGFFTGYTRSIINGRFYRDNLMTDIGADKDGVRNYLNFGVREGVQSTALDPTKDGNKVDELKKKMDAGRVHLGANFSKWLDSSFTPQEQQALGLMALAVREHRASKNPAWNRVSPIDLITSYNAADFNYVADLGAKAQQWLDQKPEEIVEGADPLEDFRKTLKNELTRGEFQDKINLWLDFNAIKNLKGSMFHQPTALATLDGVQNGVFLTGMFTGSDKNLVALGSYNELKNGQTATNLNDIRGLLFNNIAKFVDDAVGKDSEKTSAWNDLFKTLKASAEKDGGAKALYDDFSKNPIMQYSYGKDASMFRNEMSKFLSDWNAHSPEVMEKMEALRDAYDGNAEELVNALKGVMNVALKKSIDNSLTEMNKSFGFGYALLNRRPNLKDVTGDDVLLGQDDLGIVRGVVGAGESEYSTSEGAQPYDLVQTAPNTANIAGLDFEQTERQHQVGFAKGEKQFWNEEAGTYDMYAPRLGSGLANQMGVVMVQATDASLLKLMMTHVNADRTTPLPVRTVHDSLTTTPRGYLHYSNAYNNVAIPQAKNSIKKYAQNLKSDYFKQRDEVFDDIEKMGVPVGIGGTGKYAVMGAWLDDMHKKFFDPKASAEYRDNVFIKNKTPEGIAKGTQAFDDAQKRAEFLLKEARKNGWVPPFGRIRPDEKVTLDEILQGGEEARQHMAVKPQNFRKIYDLIETTGLKLSGPQSKVSNWVADFEGNVDSGYAELKRVTKRTGIGQMSF